MITNITIENYRSFKEEISFSLIAESSKSKEDNVFAQSLAQGKDELRLLKSALIYGANASGKTNLLRCLYEIISFIGRSNLKVGDNIYCYDPFKFSTTTRNKPVRFTIDFIGKDEIKYNYGIEFSLKEILKEELIYYPFGREKLLFSRLIEDNDKIHKVKAGSDLNRNDIEVFSNQSILSKFGSDIPHKIISEAFIYITNIEVINACSSRKVSILKNEISKTLVDNQILKKKMDELIFFSDTGISSLSIKEADKNKFKFPEDLSEKVKAKILDDFKYNVLGIHPLYDENERQIGDETLNIEDESHGTKTLFSLGGKILQTLESGSPLFIDEIDAGLHPFLSKLIVAIFQNKRINSKNAQLVFTTHDTNLLDRTLFRKDQIWLVEKNEQGISDIYSLQDFNDVREDTPFDKWYMAGKFGGIPNLKSLESLFVENEIS
jgi:AAA15 family ATPase/GTPase